MWRIMILGQEGKGRNAVAAPNYQAGGRMSIRDDAMDGLRVKNLVSCKEFRITSAVDFQKRTFTREEKVLTEGKRCHGDAMCLMLKVVEYVLCAGQGKEEYMYAGPRSITATRAFGKPRRRDSPVASVEDRERAGQWKQPMCGEKRLGIARLEEGTITITTTTRRRRITIIIIMTTTIKDGHKKEA